MAEIIVAKSALSFNLSKKHINHHFSTVRKQLSGDMPQIFSFFITVFFLVKKEDSLSGAPESNEPLIKSPRQE